MDVIKRPGAILVAFYLVMVDRNSSLCYGFFRKLAV